MKIFILGLLIGVLGVGIPGYLIYQNEQSKIQSLNMQLGEIKQTKKAEAAPANQDVSTLAAKLRNQQLDEMSKLSGADLELQYIMNIDVLTMSRTMLALEALKRLESVQAKVIAEKEYQEASQRTNELNPLRESLSLND